MYVIFIPFPFTKVCIFVFDSNEISPSKLLGKHINFKESFVLFWFIFVTFQWQLVASQLCWFTEILNNTSRTDEKGQMFQRHYDGAFPRSLKEMSLMTIIIYLTDGFEGGHTTFYTRKTVKVSPGKFVL
jgi:hypothetical protein